jgi:hypothetical protein
MNDKPSIRLRAIHQALHDSKFGEKVAKAQNRRVRPKSGGELIDVTLHLRDTRRAVLRLVRLKVIKKKEVRPLLAMLASADTFLRGMSLDPDVSAFEAQSTSIQQAPPRRSVQRFPEMLDEVLDGK